MHQLQHQMRNSTCFHLLLGAHLPIFTCKAAVQKSPPADIAKTAPGERVPDPMLRVAAEAMLRLEAGDAKCTDCGVFNSADIPCSDTVIDSDALVATRPGVVDAVIAHRGTHTPWQWILDVYAFRFPPWFDAGVEGFDAPRGRVHFGFLTYWLAVHETVRARVHDVLAKRAFEFQKEGKRPTILIAGAHLSGWLQ